LQQVLGDLGADEDGDNPDRDRAPDGHVLPSEDDQPAHPRIHQVEDVDAEFPQVLLDGRAQLVGPGSPTISPVGACSCARPPPPWRD
jgi:hypothetical protein